MGNKSATHEFLGIVLGFIGFASIIVAISNWQRSDEDVRYKQDQVDSYESFYDDCKDYYSKNNIINIAKAYELHKKEITEDIAFQKELGYFDEKETDEERVLSAVCKSLEKFSKNESKVVIYDLDHREDLSSIRSGEPSAKDCDSRGCVYY